MLTRDANIGTSLKQFFFLITAKLLELHYPKQHSHRQMAVYPGNVSRREQTAINRTRIEHTHLTRSLLIREESRPMFDILQNALSN